MYVKELWRYPVKSLRGERLEAADLGPDGVPGDRLLHVRGPHGVLTGRARPALLGLPATMDTGGRVLVAGRPWVDDLRDERAARVHRLLAVL